MSVRPICRKKLNYYDTSNEVDVNLHIPIPKPQSPLKEPSQENPPTTHSNDDSLVSHSLSLGDSCDTNVGQALIPPKMPIKLNSYNPHFLTYSSIHMLLVCFMFKLYPHLKILVYHFTLTFAMSTQQDIYAAGFESHSSMLNKENYVPWSSRLLCYAKSRPNGKLIHNSIINGPYVRRMIPEPGDINREVPMNETFHERFTSNEGESIESYYHRFLKLMNDLKRNKHFPEKIASNLKFLNNLQPEWSRHVTIIHQTKDLHTTDYTQLYDFLKYNQNEVDELKAERLANIQDPLALMANSNNPYAFPAPHQDQSSFNQNYMQQTMPNPEDITDPTTAMNMALVLMAKAFKLSYSTPTNNNQRISSNPRNRKITQPGMNIGQDRQMQMVGGNGGNQFRQYAGQNAGNLNRYNAVQNVRNQLA
nr:hypothetical protein [Tanacetum cinerariifolium]